VQAWRAGVFDLVASPALLLELETALARPKISRFVPEAAAEQVVADLEVHALVVDPPPPYLVRSRDPRDDYLLALAAREGAALVTGDRDLLELAPRVPIFAPREFLAQIGEDDQGGL
jgi:putative PIN family toxin of toxin-antitoxin system